MAKSIKLYEDCDVYIRQQNIEWYGYDKNLSFGEMLDKAILYKCNILTKNGNGKWYLKGLGKDYKTSEEKCIKNAGKTKRIKCWLIDF